MLRMVIPRVWVVLSLSSLKVPLLFAGSFKAVFENATNGDT